MAQLRDTLSSTILELVPVAPCRTGPPDAYDVRVWQDQQLTMQRQHSVHGRQMGHYDLRRIARAFQSAAILRNRILPVSIGDSGDPEYNENASLQVGTDWIYFVLSSSMPDDTACISTTGAGFRDILSVDVFIRNRVRETRSNSGAWYTGVFLACDLQDSVDFGHMLYRELLQAQNQRAELSLRAPDDLDELLSELN